MYIIAEIGVNHDGNVDKALELITKASECGCNAVKFQSFKADRLVDKKAKKMDFQLRSGDISETHHELIRRLEFNGEKMKKAYEFANKIDIDFITTPYDPKSASEAYDMGIRKFKTASADLSDLYIHRQLNKYKDIEVIIATGMSDISQISRTLELYKSGIIPTILHCVSGYPCKDESLNLRCLDNIRENFPTYKIGFSDHNQGFTAAIICASRGYNVFEKHFTLDRYAKGPDHYASADVSEMKAYVFELNRVNKMLGNSIKKLQEEEIDMSNRMKKGIKAKHKINKGEKITYENTYAIRPAEAGISVDKLYKLIGKSALEEINQDYFIQDEMIE